MLRIAWEKESIRVGLAVLAASLLGPAPIVGQQTSPASDTETGNRKGERIAWKIKEPTQAKECALRLAGLKRDLAARAALVTVEDDQTPFLADKLNGREVWLVTVPDWSIEYKTAPEAEDSYRRTLDILLDPRTGQVLKICSQWPKGLPGGPMVPDAKSAEEQSAPEKYHGFVSEAPGMSFLDALETAPHWAGMALKAKQIRALWVLWSSMNSEPRPVWVVELWGVLPFPALHGEHYPPSAEEHVRLVIDPSAPPAKAWVSAEHILTYPPSEVRKPAEEGTPEVP